MENIFWRGYSNDNRHAAINKIKDLVSQYGDVVDIHLFSDISINLAIEIEEIKIDSLYYELTKIIAMQEHIILNSVSKKERKIYLNVAFGKGTGNLKIEVPAVPG